MIENYKVIDKNIWSGRTDSETDYDAFRWHQWVEFIDLNDENLEPFQDKFGFAILGFESDTGIEINLGRVGAADGPNAIRKELASKPCRFSKEVKIFDAGNVSSLNTDLNDAQNSLAKAVDKILSLNLFPILLGGGHEIAFGHYKGLFNHIKKNKSDEKLGIISFDAHFDNRPYTDNKGTSGTMFRQIYDLDKDENYDFNYFVLGIQKSSNTVSLFKFAEETNTKYVYAKEISNGDIFNVFEKLDYYIEDLDHIYVSICADVFSSSIAPGVSSPQPLGLDAEKVILLLKHIIAHRKIMSFDIAEVSPRFDSDNITASLAAILIFSLVTTVTNSK